MRSAREGVLQRLNQAGLMRISRWCAGGSTRLENGPPVGYPVQFRVVGPDPQRLKPIVAELTEIMRANPHTRDVND